MIPIVDSNEIGAIGYVVAAEEIYKKCHDRNINATHLICVAESRGTQALANSFNFC